MLTIFNRRELLMTFDIGRQAEVRSLLAQNKIDYTVKVFNRNSSAYFFGSDRARTGTFGLRPEFECQYRVFVHKSDYDMAKALAEGKIKR